MDFQFLALALPLLIEEWGLTKIQAGALSSYSLMGMMVGGIVGGWLADRVGRVKVYGWSLVLFSVFTAMLAFVHSYWIFAVLRFTAGLGIAAVSMLGPVLVGEYVENEKRATSLSILQAGWSFGYLCAAMLAIFVMAVYGWRPMFFIALFPAFLIILLFKKIPEPESFTRMKSAKVKPQPIAVLFKNSKVTRISAIWSFALLFLQFGYYGCTTWLPTYVVSELGISLKGMGWYVAGTYIGMMVGKVAAGTFADKFGRRKAWFAFGVSTSIAIPLIVNYATASNVAYLLILFGLFYGSPMGIFGSYLGESFPTEVRATGFSWTYSIGRVGSIIAPVFIGAVASQYSIAMGLMTLGLSYFLMAVLPVLFIPENLYDPSKVDTEEDKVV